MSDETTTQTATVETSPADKLKRACELIRETDGYDELVAERDRLLSQVGFSIDQARLVMPAILTPKANGSGKTSTTAKVKAQAHEGIQNELAPLFTKGKHGKDDKASKRVEITEDTVNGWATKHKLTLEQADANMRLYVKPIGGKSRTFYARPELWAKV